MRLFIVVLFVIAKRKLETVYKGKFIGSVLNTTCIYQITI